LPSLVALHFAMHSSNTVISNGGNAARNPDVSGTGSSMHAAAPLSIVAIIVCSCRQP
jgi:hypothetical protein